jgi:hypothetical protein
MTENKVKTLRLAYAMGYYAGRSNTKSRIPASFGVGLWEAYAQGYKMGIKHFFELDVNN